MTLCTHGYSAPCWMCEGLLDCEFLLGLRALSAQSTSSLRQCAAWCALPPDVEPRRNQDVPISASAGDYYRSQRGQTWLLCARGPNWSLVMRVDSVPADATIISPKKGGRHGHSR